MEKSPIEGIIYSQFQETEGPTTLLWELDDLSEDIKRLVNKKSISLLRGERGFIPKSLIIIPFPSFNLKSIVKYLHVKDKSYTGGFRITAINLLFNDIEDVIFYKYHRNFESVFKKITKKITQLEKSRADIKLIAGELKIFKIDLLNLIKELRDQEISTFHGEEFPKTKEDISKFRGFKFKLIICGDPEVGKTSAVLRFTDKAFKRTYLPTIGVNISEKKVQLKKFNMEIAFTIWDIAGQQKFQSMRKHFYTGAEGVFLMFDLTSQESFLNISNWHKDIKLKLKDDFVGFLLGNKRDLRVERRVGIDEINKLAKDLNMDYIETSALTGLNIDKTFYDMSKAIVSLNELKS